MVAGGSGLHVDRGDQPAIHRDSARFRNMKAAQPVTSDLRYVVGLVYAGMDGVISARKATNFPRVGWGPACVPAFIGAAVGATRASLGPNRRSGYSTAK